MKHNSINKDKVTKNKVLPISTNVITGEQLLNMKETEIPHLWVPFIPSVGLTAVTGSSDVGKSSFLRQLATEVVLKKEKFLEFSLNVKYGSCIYVATEDNNIATSVGLKRQIGNDVKAEDLAQLRFILNNDDPLPEVKKELKRTPADLIIIDAYADVFTGQTNDVTSVRRFLNDYSSLAKEFDCAIIFLHHNGKRTEDLSPSKNNIIGSQGFEAKMRTVIELRTTGHLHEREIDFLKGNYLIDEWKKKALLLEFDENQVFSYIDTIGNKENKSNERVFQDDLKQLIIEDAKRLRETETPYDKILVQLKDKFDKLPGKTTLIKWLKENEIEDGQSVESIAA